MAHLLSPSAPCSKPSTTWSAFTEVRHRFEDHLVQQGLIVDYVLGGATALLYYSEPTFTEDIDVFVQIQSASPVVNLSPVYDYLKNTRGAREQDEYLMLSGFPIQLLLPYDALSLEAFQNAQAVSLGGRPVKLFGLENLMAIMIQLGKTKYKERMRILLQERNYDKVRLDDILARHKLDETWRRLRSELA